MSGGANYDPSNQFIFGLDKQFKKKKVEQKRQQMISQLKIKQYDLLIQSYEVEHFNAVSKIAIDFLFYNSAQFAEWTKRIMFLEPVETTEVYNNKLTFAEELKTTGFDGYSFTNEDAIERLTSIAKHHNIPLKDLERMISEIQFYRDIFSEEGDLNIASSELPQNYTHINQQSASSNCGPTTKNTKIATLQNSDSEIIETDPLAVGEHEYKNKRKLQDFDSSDSLDTEDTDNTGNYRSTNLKKVYKKTTKPNKKIKTAQEVETDTFLCISSLNEH